MSPAELLAKLRGAVSRGSGDGSPDIYKRTLGSSLEELAKRGQEMYPQTPKGSAHHQLAARIAAEKLGGGLGGLILPQIAGLGVEALEAAGGATANPEWGTDTMNDIKANAVGSWEALMDQLNQRKGVTGR